MFFLFLIKLPLFLLIIKLRRLIQRLTTARIRENIANTGKNKDTAKKQKVMSDT